MKETKLIEKKRLSVDFENADLKLLTNYCIKNRVSYATALRTLAVNQIKYLNNKSLVSKQIETISFNDIDTHDFLNDLFNYVSEDIKKRKKELKDQKNDDIFGLNE